MRVARGMEAIGSFELLVISVGAICRAVIAARELRPVTANERGVQLARLHESDECAELSGLARDHGGNEIFDIVEAAYAIIIAHDLEGPPTCRAQRRVAIEVDCLGKSVVFLPTSLISARVWLRNGRMRTVVPAFRQAREISKW